MPIPTSTILPLLETIGRRLDGDVSLGALAARARRSPFELHRAFRRVTGETTKVYTQRLRLERAAAQLVTDRRPILEIALAGGFANHEVFTRAFVRRFRMSPRAYRARGLLGVGAKRIVAKHVAIVHRVGPCIGLYHLPTPARSPIVSATVTRRDLAPQAALTITKSIGPSEIATTIAECLPRVFAYAQQQGIALVGPPFARYHDMRPGRMTLEAGMPIAAPAAGSGDIAAIELPGGPAAVAIHRGHYEKLGETHAAVADWIAKQGLDAASSPWEVYITDPGETPDPASWETQVIHPVRG